VDDLSRTRLIALIEIERDCVGFASRELRERAAPAHLADLHKYLEMKTAGESRSLSVDTDTFE